MYADYYVLIKDPISFKEIKQRCADSKYKTFEDLAKDFRLMFKNAKVAHPARTARGSGREGGACVVAL
jgi:hypothetical protein